MKDYRVLVILILTFLWSGLVSGAGYDAPNEIKATLPKFCWAQYFDNVPTDDPDYSISGCGSMGNHYCPGLVKMAQAGKTKSNGERLGLLSMAKADMQYTINNTAEVPDCFLRPLAQANVARIDFQ